MQPLSITSLIPLDRVCPLAKRPFRELAKQQFQKSPPVPYILAVVAGNGTAFRVFDALSLQRWNDEKGGGFWIPAANDHPLLPAMERITLIHYLFMNSFSEPPRLLNTCTEPNAHVQDYLRACSPESREEAFEARAKTVNWLFEKKRWHECAFWTQVFLEQFPKDLPILKRRAELLLDKETGIVTSPSEKIMLLEHIIGLDPTCDKLATLLGQIYLRGAREVQPDLEKARRYFDIALKANEKNQEALCLRTKLMCIGSSKSDKSKERRLLLPTTTSLTMKVLAELGKIPQSHQPSLAELADILRLDNCLFPEYPQKAFNALRRILEIDPENGFAHARIGELYRVGSADIFEKDKVASLKHFQRAIQIAPEDAFALSRSAALAIETAQPDLTAVLKTLEKARALVPTCTFTMKWLVQYHLQCSKNLLEAKRLLEELLGLDSDNLFALIELAILLTYGSDDFAQDVETANQLFQNAYKISSKNKTLLNGWGELLRLYGDGKRKDPQQAKKLFCETLAIEGTNYFAKSRVAEILRKTAGSLKIAAELFLDVLQQVPLDSFSEARLGAIYLFGGPGVPHNYDASEQLLRSAIAHNPHDPFALSHFGELQRRIGKDFTQALHFLQLAYDKDPNDPDTLSFLGLFFLRGGDGIEPNRNLSSAYFEKACRLAPEDSQISERSRQPSCLTFEETKTPKRVKSLLEANLTATPNNPFLMISLGETLLRDVNSTPADFKKAEALLKQARTLRPDNLDAIKALAEVYRVQPTLFANAYKKAIELFELANQKEPNNPETLARFGFCLKKTNDFKKAEEILLAAKSLAPENVLILALLGDLSRLKAQATHLDQRAKQQLQGEAALLFKQALHNDNTCKEAWFGLAELALDQEQIKEAKANFQQILQIDPEDSDAQAGMGRCLESIPFT